MATANDSLKTYAYVANGNSNTVSVIDTARNEVIKIVHVGNGPNGVAVNSKGTRVYVTNYNSNNVSIINTATNTVFDTVPVGANPVGVAVTPDGKKVFVANFGSNSVSIIDTTTTPNSVKNVDKIDAPQGVAVNPTGSRVVVTGGSNVYFFDTESESNIPVKILGPFDKSIGVAFTPDGSKVYVANFGKDYVTRINTSGYGLFIIKELGDRPYGVAVNSNGTKVYVGANGKLAVIDGSTDTILPPYILLPGVHRGVSVTPDEKELYVTNDDGTVSVIDTATNIVKVNVTVGAAPYAFGQFITTLPLYPLANFSSNVTSGKAPLDVQFNDSSLNADNVTWDFGDGNNNSTRNPVHTFSKEDDYTVRLTVGNANGTNSTDAAISVSNVASPTPTETPNVSQSPIQNETSTPPINTTVPSPIVLPPTPTETPTASQSPIQNETATPFINITEPLNITKAPPSIPSFFAIPALLVVFIGIVILLRKKKVPPQVNVMPAKEEIKRYCMHCGEPMTKEASNCPHCGQTPPSGVDTKQCSTCDAVLPQSAKYCDSCKAEQLEVKPK